MRKQKKILENNREIQGGKFIDILLMTLGNLEKKPTQA